MNFKSVISFAVVMIFSVIMYFVISNYQDKSSYNNQYNFYSNTEIKVTPYKPKGSSDFNKQYNEFQIIDNNSSSSYNHQVSVIYPYATNETVEKASSGSMDYLLKSGYPTSQKNNYTQSAGNIYSDHLAFISRGKSTSSTTIGTSTYSSNIDPTGLLSAKSSIFAENHSIFNNNEYGLPDPGGDPVVFIPVPDGLWVLIFFLTLYVLWKIGFSNVFTRSMTRKE